VGDRLEPGEDLLGWGATEFSVTYHQPSAGAQRRCGHTWAKPVASPPTPVPSSAAALARSLATWRWRHRAARCRSTAPRQPARWSVQHGVRFRRRAGRFLGGAWVSLPGAL